MTDVHIMGTACAPFGQHADRSFKNLTRLADREISYPLTWAMCSPLGDGAAAAILCSAAALADFPSAARARAVKVRTSALSGGKYRALDEPGLSKIAADKAYAKTGLAPADFDLAEVHDATPFLRDLSARNAWTVPGRQWRSLHRIGATRLGGKMPVNVSGGLVSKGHPSSATGVSTIYGTALQLRAEAGARQAPGASLALIENGAGVMGFDEAACAITILEKTS